MNIPYTLRDFTLKTVGDVLLGEGSILLGVGLKSFLLTKNESVENWQNILQLNELSEVDRIQFESNVEQLKKIQSNVFKDSDIPEQLRNNLYSIPIKIGTVVYIPPHTIDSDLIRADRITPIDSTSFPYFIAKKLKQLHEDITFEKTTTFSNENLGKLKQIYPDITVWVWSRALSSQFFSGESFYQDKIINITPFISNLSTSVSADGGTFTVDLPYVSADLINQEWQFRQNSVKRTSTHYTANSTPTYLGKDGLEKNRVFFDVALQPNDIVFIRFEVLEKEKQLIQKNKNLFYIPVEDVPKGVFDMIGLIDTVSLTEDANLNNGVSVVGRDLMKLLIEDGVYFYPFDFIQGGMFANEKDTDRLQRFDGKLLGRFQQGFKTVENALGFILNSLGEIKISSDTLFEPYGDDREFKRIISTEVLEKRREKNQQLDTLRQEIKDLITKARKNDNLLPKDSNIDPKVTSVFVELNSFIQSLIDQEIREVRDILKETSSGVSGWENYIYRGNNYQKNSLPQELQSNSPNPFVSRKIIIINNTGISKKERDDAYNRSQRFLFHDIQSLEVMRKNLSYLLDKDIEKKKSTETNQKYLKRLQSELNELDQRESKRSGNYLSRDAQLKVDKINRSSLSFREKQDSVAKIEEEDLRKYEVNLVNKIIVGATTKKISLRVAPPSDDKQLFLDIVFDDLQGQLEQQDATTFVQEIQAKKDLEIVKKYDDGIQYVKVPKKINELSASHRQAIDKMLQFIKLSNKPIDNQFDIVPQKGIWSIVRLVVDDSVRDRRIVSADLGNEMGSMINAVKKICQEPFTEFFGDTYGNSYHLVVRKPPFDREGVTSYIDKKISIEQPQIKSSNTQNPSYFDQQETPTRSFLIIDIEESDIVSETLTYGGQAYSWYKLRPQSSIGGFDDSTALAFLKAVYFPEYAEIWGSRPLDLITNYIPYFPKEGTSFNQSTSYLIQQGINDLKYMIESNQYLPFVRSGTITMNPDRRIKRGTWVRRKATGEVFYVDSVQNDYSIGKENIDRTTTINVNRGMVEKYITHPKYNYFNIISTEIDKSVFTRQSSIQEINEASISKWKVNKDVFNFFLKKMQFNRKIDNFSIENYDNLASNGFNLIDRDINNAQTNTFTA